MSAPGYSFAAAARILEVGESRLRHWAKTGLVGPSLSRQGKRAFSFQDLVAAKATKELVDRGVSAARVRRALDSVRAALPGQERPLDRLRVTYDGESLLVVDDGAAFELSGQRVFDFGLGELKARAAGTDTTAATPIGRAAGRAAPDPGRGGFDWLGAGLVAEADGDLDEAARCFRKALEVDPGLAAAHTNLGALAIGRGELAEARARFEQALALDPDQAEARYNLAAILYESGERDLAAAEWKRVLALHPDFADAHYNLATVLEELGGKRQAREHLLRYLELVADADDAHAPWAEEARARLSRL